MHIGDADILPGAACDPGVELPKRLGYRQHRNTDAQNIRPQRPRLCRTGYCRRLTYRLPGVGICHGTARIATEASIGLAILIIRPDDTIVLVTKRRKFTTASKGGRKMRLAVRNLFINIAVLEAKSDKFAHAF